MTDRSAPSRDEDPHGSFVGSLISLLRVHHWIKSLFILLPLPFAIAAGISPTLLELLLGVLGFSFVSSAVYIFNDIQDMDGDRSHPVKRKRALASGRVEVAVARRLGILVLVSGLIILGFTGDSAIGFHQPWILAVIYLIGNVLYSIWARSVAWLDVTFLGAFFLLRLLLGCSLVKLQANPKLLVTGFLLAIALALGKRFSELVSGVSSQYRPSLLKYRQGSLYRATLIAVCGCLIGYLWSCQTSPLFLPGRWWWSVIPAGLGLILYLDEVLRRKTCREPVAILLNSIWPRWVIPLWIGAVIWSSSG